VKQGEHSGPVQRTSILRCPDCATETEEQMPTDACVYFFHCTVCNTRIRPKEGDCCVFCSYGTVPCPPVQQSRNCC
jgi:hypothetical protein